MGKNINKMQASNSSSSIRNITLIAYSGPAIPLAMLFVPLINYLPTYYTAEVGISLYWTGFAFMFARIWDGITDPLIGSLSDATRSRFGKRRIWMLVGLFPFIVSTYFLFNPPDGISNGYLIVWISLFYIFWTIIQVPYLSWGADLSGNYDERTKIFGFRETGTTLGIVISSALPMVFLSRNATMGEILELISYAVIIIIPIVTIAAAFYVGERSSVKKLSNKGGLIQSLKINKPYRRFLLFSLLFISGINISNAVLVFYIQHRLNLENDFISLVLVVYLVAIIAIPLCVKLSNRIGRHRVLGISGLGLALAYVLMAFIPKGDYWITVACFMLIGVCAAATWAMPPAIVGDLADFGNLKGQGEKAGSYMAGYNLVYKLGTALGVGIGLPLLQLMGFDSVAQDSSANVDALIRVGSFLPALIVTLSIFLIWNFPINSKRQRIIQKYLLHRDRKAANSP